MTAPAAAPPVATAPEFVHDILMKQENLRLISTEDSQSFREFQQLLEASLAECRRTLGDGVGASTQTLIYDGGPSRYVPGVLKVSPWQFGMRTDYAVLEPILDWRMSRYGFAGGQAPGWLKAAVLYRLHHQGAQDLAWRMADYASVRADLRSGTLMPLQRVLDAQPDSGSYREYCCFAEYAAFLRLLCKRHAALEKSLQQCLTSGGGLAPFEETLRQQAQAAFPKLQPAAALQAWFEAETAKIVINPLMPRDPEWTLRLLDQQLLLEVSRRDASGQPVLQILPLDKIESGDVVSQNQVNVAVTKIIKLSFGADAQTLPLLQQYQGLLMAWPTAAPQDIQARLLKVQTARRELLELVRRQHVWLLEQEALWVPLDLRLVELIRAQYQERQRRLLLLPAEVRYLDELERKMEGR